MPRFLTMFHVDEQHPFSDPTPEFLERAGAVTEEMTRAGVLLDTAALAPTAEGTRMTWSGGKLSRTDGPFAETKEVVGGYCLMRCADMAEALEWTDRFLRVHPEDWTVTFEVREVTGD